jgi:hypothetical protein
LTTMSLSFAGQRFFHFRPSFAFAGRPTSVCLFFIFKTTNNPSDRRRKIRISKGHPKCSRHSYTQNLLLMDLLMRK